MKHALMILGLVALTCSAESITPSLIYDGAKDMDAWNAAMGSKLVVDANVTIGITNGTFAVGGDSTFVGENAALMAFKDAVLNFTAATGGTKSFGLREEGSRFVLDGATFNIAVRNGQCFFGNGATSRPLDCSWDVWNGGQVVMPSTGSNKNAYRWICGGNNRMTVVDSTLDVGNISAETDRQFQFYGAWNCMLAMTNATLKLIKGTTFGFVNATNSTANFCNSTVTSGTAGSGTISLAFADTSVGNTAEFSGTEGEVSFTTVNMNGVGDTLRLANANFSPAVNLGGTSNRLAIARAGYKVSQITCNDPIAPVVAIEGGGVVSNQYLRTTSDFAPYVDGSTIDVCGGAFKLSRFLQLDGSGKTIRVRDGGSVLIGLEPSATANARNALRFTSGTTSGCTISIEDNGVFETHTAINRAVGDYNWTDCPNTAIVFKGHNPRFNVLVTMDATYALVLGTSNEDTFLTDPVKLRFEVPAGNYDRAPLWINGDNRPAIIYGNQPIEVAVDPSLVAGTHDRILIPLVHDAKGFSAAPLDATRLAKLTAHATIPEKTRFVVVNDAEGNGKTLCLAIPGNKGLMVIFR